MFTMLLVNFYMITLIENSSFQEIAEECMYKRGNRPLTSDIHLDFDILWLPRLILWYKIVSVSQRTGCPWAVDVISLVLSFLVYNICKLVDNHYPFPTLNMIIWPTELNKRTYLLMPRPWKNWVCKWKHNLQLLVHLLQICQAIHWNQ